MKEDVIHPLKPIVNKDCKILILGSFPSVKSREIGFYYAHKQNRFWKVMASLFNVTIPSTNEEKVQLLLDNHIALFDSIASCTIKGSSDSSIENVIVNDIEGLIKDTKISKIYCNGNASYKYFKKYHPHLKASLLPSTSSANAKYSLDDLVKKWKDIL